MFDMGKPEWLSYNLVIRSRDDRLSRLGTIQQCDRHTDSHVAIAHAPGGKNYPVVKERRGHDNGYSSTYPSIHLLAKNAQGWVSFQGN